MILYGLKACDTCRKARQELEKAGKTVEFVDVRETPLSGELLSGFSASFGDTLVNRRSTTWRNLTESDRTGTPKSLIAAHPTLMKRPVIRDGDVLTLGWDAKTRAMHLGNSSAAS